MEQLIARYCKHEHLLTMVRMQRQSKPKHDDTWPRESLFAISGQDFRMNVK